MEPLNGSNLRRHIEAAGTRDIIETKVLEMLVRGGIVPLEEINDFIAAARRLNQSLVTYALVCGDLTTEQLITLRNGIRAIYGLDEQTELLHKILTTCVREGASEFRMLPAGDTWHIAGKWGGAFHDLFSIDEEAGNALIADLARRCVPVSGDLPYRQFQDGECEISVEGSKLKLQIMFAPAGTDRPTCDVWISTSASADVFEEQMRRWIGQHGSAHLKDAIARGYNATGIYVRERAAKEFPGFTVVSRSKKFVAEARSNPTAAGLNLLAGSEALVDSLQAAQQYQPRLVRISKNELDEETGAEVGVGEAVLIEGYLGRDNYLLVQPVSAQRQVERMLRRWAMMADAGIPLNQILETLLEQEQNLAVRSALEDLLEHSKAGGTITSKFVEYPHLFPAHIITMIQVGEESGDIRGALNRLAAEGEFVSMRDLIEWSKQSGVPVQSWGTRS